MRVMLPSIKLRWIQLRDESRLRRMLDCLRCATLQLSTVVSLLNQLQVAQGGHTAVLWLPDWSSIAVNSLGGDHKR
jgi:hypothetical protein